jgi:hypothetical protein
LQTKLKTKTAVTKLEEEDEEGLPEQCRDDGRGTGFAAANRIINAKSRVVNK